MYRVMCVTDRKSVKGDFYGRLREIAASSVYGIILREKDLCEDEYRRMAIRARDICGEYGANLILHNRYELAEEIGLTAVHLPFVRLKEINNVHKTRFSQIGVSCHSVEDAIAAERVGCTYITAGHIFETDCKRGLKGRGLDFLKEVADSVSVPVYAIGGISALNIRQVMSAGADGVCVMSGAMRAENAAEYLDALIYADEG